VRWLELPDSAFDSLRCPRIFQDTGRGSAAFGGQVFVQHVFRQPIRLDRWERAPVFQLVSSAAISDDTFLRFLAQKFEAILLENPDGGRKGR
jgi:hypothetical protein